MTVYNGSRTTVDGEADMGVRIAASVDGPLGPRLSVVRKVVGGGTSSRVPGRKGSTNLEVRIRRTVLGSSEKEKPSSWIPGVERSLLPSVYCVLGVKSGWRSSHPVYYASRPLLFPPLHPHIFLGCVNTTNHPVCVYLVRGRQRD